MPRTSDVIVNTKLRVQDSTSPHLVRMSRLARGASNSVRSIGTGLGLITAGAGVATLAVGGLAYSLVRLSNNVAERADEFAKFGRQVDISAQLLQNLEFVAGRQGASFENITSGIEAFTKRVGEAREGTGALSTFLGSSDAGFLTQLQAIESNEQALGVYLQRLSEFDNPQDASAFASAAFGRTAGADFIRMLDGGVENFQNLVSEAQAIRPAFSNDTLSNAEAYSDAMFDAGQALKSVRDTLAIGLIPLITEAADGFSRWVVANRDFIASTVDTVVANLADSMQRIDWVSVASSAAAFATSLSGINWAAIVEALALMAENINLLVSAMTALVAVLTGGALVSAASNLGRLSGAVSVAGAAGGAAAPTAAGGGALTALAGAVARLSAPVAVIAGSAVAIREMDQSLRTPEAFRRMVETHTQDRAPIVSPLAEPVSNVMDNPMFSTLPNTNMVANEIARQLEGSIDMNVTVRVEGNGTVSSVGTTNSAGLIGPVSTNRPRVGPQ